MLDIDLMIQNLELGDYRSIASCITMVENDLPGSSDLLRSLPPKKKQHIVGITGPPGAGKSTMVNALLRQLSSEQKKVAVLSVDPSSPFNYGALLGDRIRMSEFYLHPNVYIRSLASRGSLGGLNATMIEILDVLSICPFDYILVETVGVGQSEVEIAGLAETTIVVCVPEAGDEVQTMKAGVMEIADIFVVNKSDRANADDFVKNLKSLAHQKAGEWEIPVVKCVATMGEGIHELVEKMRAHHHLVHSNEKQQYLLAEKAFQLIQQKKMKGISKSFLYQQITLEIKKGNFNLYRFIDSFE